MVLSKVAVRARTSVSTVRGAPIFAPTSRGIATRASPGGAPFLPPTSRGIATRASAGRAPASPRGAPAFAPTSRGIATFLKGKIDKIRNFEPSDRASKRFDLLAAVTTVTAGLGYGYYQVAKENRKYVDEKMVEVKCFQNIATSTHIETVKRFNDEIHYLKNEVSYLKGQILDMKMEEFRRYKEQAASAEKPVGE